MKQPNLGHCMASPVTMAQMSSILNDMLEEYEDDHGLGTCDCRPEPENFGHVCTACKARSILRQAGYTDYEE